jgi:hypothetical protein
MLAKLITFFIVGLVAIVLLRGILWIAGAAFGLGLFLLFTVGPILLIGWIVVRAARWLRGNDRYANGY